MHYITLQVQSILLENGFLDIKVVEVDRRMTMVYEITTNELRLNPKIVEDYIENDERMSRWFAEDIILNAMLFHEIGHYLDFKENPKLIELASYYKFNGSFEEYKLFCIEREKRAWEIGSTLIDEDYLEAFDMLNRINMHSYENMELKER